MKNLYRNLLTVLACVLFVGYSNPSHAVTVCSMDDGGAVSATTKFWTSDGCGTTPATVSHTATQVLSYLEGATTLPSVVFKTIAVSGQSDVVADGATDTLTFAAGTGIALTTTAGTDDRLAAPLASPARRRGCGGGLRTRRRRGGRRRGRRAGHRRRLSGQRRLRPGRGAEA